MNSLKKTELIFLLLVFLIAFFLRIYKLDQNLFFGWEQGRDAFIINDIIKGNKLTLIGPKTDIEGVFHGAFYYYLMAIPYFLGRGNPLWAGYFLALISALGSSVLYLIGKNELKYKTRAIAALFYTFGFQENVFSRWLSNPTLTLPFSIFLIYNLKQEFNKKNFFIALLFWGCIFHFELAAAFFLLPVFVYYIFRNFSKFNIRLFFQSVFILLFIFSPYFLFNIRHENILATGLIRFITSHQDISFNILEFINRLYSVIQREFYLSIFPASPLIAKIIFFLSIMYLIFKRQKYIVKIIFFWFFAPLVLMLLTKTIPMSQVLIFLGGASCLIASIIIERMTSFKQNFLAFSVLFLILFSNFNYFKERVSSSENFFFRSYQYTFLGDQKRVLDYIYTQAEGKEFSYNYYSFPYWLPQSWDYLFSWYGNKKYGYLPMDKRTQIFYVIIEPDEVTPKYQQDWYNNLNKESKLIKSFSAGNLRAEQRTTF